MDCSRSPSKNPDTWLSNCPDFSRDLCGELRHAFFRWEPDLTESIKWNNLCFSGRKLVCCLSGCKKHVGISFFRGTELDDPAGLFNPDEDNTWIRTIRVTKPEDLNRPALRKLLHAAVRLDADMDILPPPPRTPKPWPMPDYFVEALRGNKKAAAFFESLAPSYRKEYIVWLTTAKREETRMQRLFQTLTALAAGKKWLHRKEA